MNRMACSEKNKSFEYKAGGLNPAGISAIFARKIDIFRPPHRPAPGHIFAPRPHLNFYMRTLFSLSTDPENFGNSRGPAAVFA